MTTPPYGSETRDSLSEPLNGPRDPIDHEALVGPELRPHRPLLNVLPKSAPNVALSPLQTQCVFKTPVLKPASTVQNSDSSSWCKSTHNEHVGCTSKLTKSSKRVPVADFSVASSNSEKAASNFCTSGLKSALKKASPSQQNSTIFPPTGPSMPSSTAPFHCSPPHNSLNVQSAGRRTVRITEPVDQLAELHELRKSFAYDRRGGSKRRKQVYKPLPPFLKVGRQSGMTIELVQKKFPRTPSATSSAAREKWCLSRASNSPEEH